MKSLHEGTGSSNQALKAWFEETEIWKLSLKLKRKKLFKLSMATIFDPFGLGPLSLRYYLNLGPFHATKEG